MTTNHELGAPMSDRRIILRSTRPPHNTFAGNVSQFTPSLQSWLDVGWQEDVHARAVEIFEQRMGFGYTGDYEQSREWSDAMAEATQPFGLPPEADANPNGRTT